ncbi:cupin domain-containing protein [Streptomonospora sp. S1-112]|uniref:Cupin domain-containing protein n=1 Tax=Streptomonospora mangrovi TaxID=2883123 RepID=A0A9X3NPP4_9ACTN|nr:cupin domain-containing protein [Streptomonospora mangrovi]MDA0565659.1 cupin domain-containing protein [Streptomonospora mangrovi]
MTGALERLVGDVAELRRRWEERPLVSRGLGDFDDVFSLELLDRLFFEVALPTSALRLMRDGAVSEAGALARARERTGPTSETLVDPAKAAAELRRGTTLVFEEVRSWCPPVADLARGVAEATGYDTYCAAFLTPAGARGARAHYDMASVFIRQVHGSKRWTVGAPAERPPARPWKGRDVALTDPEEVLLRPGDCLYLPRGYIHVGDATHEASLHLSIALKPVTWRDVLVREITALAEADPRLRRSLPFGFHRDGGAAGADLLAEHTRIAVGHLADTAAVWRRAADHYAPPAPRTGGGLAKALAEGGAPAGEEEESDVG